MTPIWVIGSGGHANVVIDALKGQGGWQIAGIVSDDPSSLAVEPGVPHVGPVSVETVRLHGIARAILAIGANSVRQRLSRILDGEVQWASAVHPSAIIAPTALVGQGVLLAAGSIVQPFATIGDHTIINTGATVDHDSVIGACAHIAPGAHLAGNVTVGEGTLIGVGSSIVPGITIGRDAVVGAGSVVIRDVPGGAKVAGNPAKLIGRV